MVAVAATVVLAAAVVAGVGAIIAGGVEEQPPAPVPQMTQQTTQQATLRWAVGACVDRTGSRYELVACDAGDAEVVAVAGAPYRCPAATDELADIGLGRTACVRNRRAPHPGEPGAGGGVLRAGDCLRLDGREVPCAAKGWYGRAAAVTAGACPARTRAVFRFSYANVCLGPAGRVPREGACVARPDGDRLVRVGCGSPRAWARVTGFAGSARRCPEGSDRYLPGGHRSVTCLRLVNK